MGNSLNIILPQWECLLQFLKNQLKNKKELNLDKKTINFITKLIKILSDNSVKYIAIVYSYIFENFNEKNLCFQSDNSKIHKIFPQSRDLLNKFSLFVNTDEKNKFIIDQDFKTN